MDNNVKPIRRRGAVSAESGNVEEKEEKEPTKYPKDEKTLQHLDNVLKNNILFNHLEEKERKFLWQFLFQQTFTPGQTIIQQGKKNNKSKINEIRIKNIIYSFILIECFSIKKFFIKILNILIFTTNSHPPHPHP